MGVPLDVTVVTDNDPDYELILEVPGVRQFVKRYTEVVGRLTDIELLALVYTANRETRNRADKLRAKRTVGIGNRPG